MTATACPVCQADGVRACTTPDGIDHRGRPPYFTPVQEEVLDAMGAKMRKEREAHREKD